MHKVSGSSMGSSGLTQSGFPCPPPTQVTKTHVPVTYIYFTFVNVFIIFTTTSRTGSALLSALWRAAGTHNQPYKPCSAEVLGLSRNLPASRKFPQKSTSAHAESSCSMERCKGDTSEEQVGLWQVTHCLAIPVLLSKVQRKEPY